MLISTKGRYALRLMLDLAEHDENQFISLNEIAERQEFSEKYTESIMKNLVKEGLVKSYRGKTGGYRLARHASEIKVPEIISAAEGPISPVSCTRCAPNLCPRAGSCKTLPLWTALKANIDSFLDGITLADVRDGHLPGITDAVLSDDEGSWII